MNVSIWIIWWLVIVVWLCALVVFVFLKHLMVYWETAIMRFTVFLSLLSWRMVVFWLSLLKLKICLTFFALLMEWSNSKVFIFRVWIKLLLLLLYNWGYWLFFVGIFVCTSTVTILYQSPANRWIPWLLFYLYLLLFFQWKLLFMKFQQIG